MERESFEALCANHKEALEKIRSVAHQLHENVNQYYDGDKPYAYHLDKVAKEVYTYGHHVLVGEEDFLPLFMGAWFHDSIEDARVSYNDVKKIGLKLGLTEEQTFLASEIVYALTNEKGRTRKERAGKRYYEGIRNTPYAPFVKMCDRVAVMYLGKIVESADSKEIYANPQHPYTQALFSAVPVANPHKKSEPAALEGELPSPANPPKGCKFHTRCKHCTNKCREIPPKMIEVSEGHFVACHLYAENTTHEAE